MPTRASLLRHVITIQNPATVAGIQKWTKLATCYAQIMPESGSEHASGLGPTTVEMTQLTIRYQAGIKPKQRIMYGTRTLEISSVSNENENNRWLMLTCREVVT
jgi:SPP1 family predicted phage head-tail adaptor